VIEIDPVLRYAQVKQHLALCGEILSPGRATGVADEDSGPVTNRDSRDTPARGVWVALVRSSALSSQLRPRPNCVTPVVWRIHPPRAGRRRFTMEAWASGRRAPYRCGQQTGRQVSALRESTATNRAAGVACDSSGETRRYRLVR
jgi:hypothetical protein